MVAGARRGLDRVWAARRGGQPSGGFFLRHLSAARQGQMARRQAGDRRGRDLLLRCLQDQPSAVLGLLQPRHQGGEDRRARGHLHLRRARQSRTAADRRPAQRAAQALVGGHRQGRQQARRRRDHARAAARLRRLPHQGVRARPHASSTSASRTIGARTSTSTSAATTSTSMRYEYFRDSTVALEAFKADAVDWRTENSAKNWATAYDFPAVKDGRVRPGGIPDPQSSGGMQALRLQHPPRRSSRIRACAAPSTSRFDFEEMNKQMFFGQYKRIEQLFRGHGACVERTAARARSSRSWRRCATRCRRRSSPRPTPIRSAATPEAVRANLREAMRLLREAGYEVRDQKLVNAKTGEPFTRRIPDRSSRTASASCCPTSRRSSGSASR